MMTTRMPRNAVEPKLGSLPCEVPLGASRRVDAARLIAGITVGALAFGMGGNPLAQGLLFVCLLVASSLPLGRVDVHQTSVALRWLLTLDRIPATKVEGLTLGPDPRPGVVGRRAPSLAVTIRDRRPLVLFGRYSDLVTAGELIERAVGIPLRRTESVCDGSGLPRLLRQALRALAAFAVGGLLAALAFRLAQWP
jgi:hypothetical protein